MLCKNKAVVIKVLEKYIKARDQCQIAADISKEIYLPDLTYGPQSWLRGRWDDRLPAIERDIEEMKKKLSLKKFIKNSKKNKTINTNLKKMENWKNSKKIKVGNTPQRNFI
mgnify:CR=1 FL=1